VKDSTTKDTKGANFMVGLRGGGIGRRILALRAVEAGNPADNMLSAALA